MVGRKVKRNSGQCGTPDGMALELWAKILSAGATIATVGWQVWRLLRAS
jgi:hypothetical protein